jgi:hypothetical protein
MSELYNEDRVRRLARIQRSFSSCVRVGDEVEFGLAGDPLFPQEYRNSRPKGKVIRVKGVGTDGASIRVKLVSGSVVDVMPYSLDPRRVWEFSDEFFPQVLKRNTKSPETTTSRSQNDARQAHEMDYGSMVPKSDYDALLKKVDMLSSRLDKEMTENKNFNGAIVASFSEMAKEVRKVAKDDETPFCDTFTNEYRTMIESGSIPKKNSPFDSDFSDSDDNY